MAAKEPFDYLSEVTADHNKTLSVSPQNAVWESGSKNVVVHVGDDGTEERVVLSDSPTMYLRYTYNTIEGADAGTIYEFYWDSSYGNGMTYSFYLDGIDDHTYTVRFETHLERRIGGPPDSRNYGYNTITFKVLGVKPS